MMEPDDRLISPVMLYRFAVDCPRVSEAWDRKSGITLPDTGRLPVFSELDDQRTWADVRTGWNDDGLYLSVDVRGKQQSPWCRSTQLLESDGFQVWIDTRDTHNIHRASRFCHWFLFLPTGGGSRRNSPLGTMLKINRARDFPKSFGQADTLVAATLRNDGYQMSIMIPAAAMDGWNPEEHRHLGFNYAVTDRELGWQSLAIGPEFPVAEDPALWQTLSLTDSPGGDAS